MNKEIKIMEPFERGFDRMMQFCFHPFDFSRWMIMGFITWVLFLGEGWGDSNGFSFPQNFMPDMGSGSSSGGGANEIFAEIKDFFTNQITSEIIWVIVAVAVIVLTVWITLAILFVWLKARFEFIFLDNIISEKHEIADPWIQFNELGHSLFMWRIFFLFFSMFISLFMFSATVGVTVWLCYSSFKAGKLLSEGVTGIVIGSFLLCCCFAVLFVFSLVRFVVRQFLVPVMYKKGIGIRKAWSILRPAVAGHRMDLVLFIITYWAISVAAGIVIWLVMLCTCSLCCIGAVPFLGGCLIATLTLPLSVFMRYFSYEYVMQFDLNTLKPEYP